MSIVNTIRKCVCTVYYKYNNYNTTTITITINMYCHVATNNLHQPYRYAIYRINKIKDTRIVCNVTDTRTPDPRCPQCGIHQCALRPPRYSQTMYRTKNEANEIILLISFPKDRLASILQILDLKVRIRFIGRVLKLAEKNK